VTDDADVGSSKPITATISACVDESERDRAELAALRVQLERVRALPETWRAEQEKWGLNGYQCAQDLEAELDAK